MIFVFTRKKLMKMLCIIAVVICSVITVKNGGIQATFSSSASNDWGLSYRENGKTPEGNASKEFLKDYNAFYVGDDSQKSIYLTFDAGYENGYTESILDTLKKHNVKGTFFLVGNYLETKPEIVKRMAEEGHIVGNHTYSHPDMSAISTAEAFAEELNKMESKCKDITGKDMLKIYRPPQGKFSEENLTMAKAMGYKTMFWSLAYVDWLEDKQPTKEEAFSKLLTRIHPGAVVLLHSTSKTNCEILDELLTKWKDMGYTFKSIEELN